MPGNQFVALEGTKVVANQIYPILSETFDIVKETECSTRVRIKAANGFYLQVILQCIYFSILPCLLILFG